MINQKTTVNCTIVQMSHENVEYLNSFDSEFMVTGYLDLQIENNTILYKIIATEPRTKKYEEQEINAKQYIDSKQRAVFFAFIEDACVGQIIVKENWNKYGFIEDVRIKSEVKGRGIGKVLIERAKLWAIDAGLGGLTLETQSINTDACLFYEKCGFVMGGFDSYFYKQFPNVQKEIALYWYWLNENSAV